MLLEVPPLADTNTETSEAMEEFGSPPQGKFYAGSLLRHILWKLTFVDASNILAYIININYLRIKVSVPKQQWA